MGFNPIEGIKNTAKNATDWVTGIPERFREMDRRADLEEVAMKAGRHMAASTIDSVDMFANYASHLRRSGTELSLERRKDLVAAMVAASEVDGVRERLSILDDSFKAPGFCKVFDAFKSRAITEGDLATIASAFEVAAQERGRKYFSSYPLEVDDKTAERYSRADLFRKSGNVAVFDVEMNQFVQRQYAESSTTYKILKSVLPKPVVRTPKAARELVEAA